MTIREAYNIKRRHKTGIITLPPFALNNLSFRVYKYSVKIVSPVYETIYVSISKEIFLEQKKKFNIKFMYSYDDFDEYQLHERVFVTSQGVVSEEDFELAGDIIDNLQTIKKKELREDIKYISDKGKEYFYLKCEKGSLYDRKLRKQVLKDSIRIVDIIL